MSVGSISPVPPVGPPKDCQIKWSLPAHIRYRVISPRNVQLVAGLSPRGCPGCHGEYREGALIAYRGKRLCPACFVAAADRDRAEAVARLTFTARARAYLEREGIGREIVP